jgi:UDP-glucose 4-epimerase
VRSLGHVLVTGGCGFIGSHLVRTLIKEDIAERITVLDVQAHKPMHSGHVRYVQCNMTDRAWLENELAAIGPVQTVFHMAANASVPYSIEYPVTTMQHNMLATVYLLEFYRKSAGEVFTKPRFIFSSSAAVYGKVDGAVNESMVTRPLSPYGLEKAASEQYLRLYAELYGFETMSLRYMNVYGPGQSDDSPYSGVVAKVRRALHDSTPFTIFGDGEQARDYVHVTDVVRANIIAAHLQKHRMKGHSINVGTGKAVTLNALVEVVQKLRIQAQKPVLQVVYDEPRVGEIRISIANVSRMKHVLQMPRTQQVALHAGLRELVV